MLTAKGSLYVSLSHLFKFRVNVSGLQIGGVIEFVAALRMAALCL